MANTRSAEKRNRQSLKRRSRNRSYRSRLQGAVKKLRSAVSEGNGERARELLPEALRLIDRTAQKNVIHRNAAARRKSRLVKLVRQLEN